MGYSLFLFFIFFVARLFYNKYMIYFNKRILEDNYMGLELNIILAYAVGLILLYVVGWILLIPLKWIIKLMWSSILGGIMLFVINLVGGIWNITLTINPLSAAVAGVLGIPGVILLLLLKYVL